ncbi:MAG TPA: mycofactocin biosynthesis chaperone MftB [Euzebyales bacterium]|nr:mycofactocin biosynthesis chaperone MftB [Euzebyales bacterium]
MLADQAWRLSGSVSLRPEQFGALAYDFATRKLSFLKSPQLVDVVRRLESSPTVGQALTDAGVEGSRRAAFLRALESLAASGMLCRPEGTGDDTDGPAGGRET